MFVRCRNKHRVNKVTRDRLTLRTYLAFVCLGWMLNGLGAILPALQTDLGVDRAAVARYPAMFGVGLLVVGLVGDRLALWLGAGRLLRLAMTGLGAGACLLAVTALPALSLAGAALLGGSGALLVYLVPAVLSAHHGTRAATPISEANACASAAGVAAPFAVAAALALSMNWRVGFLAIPVVLLAVFLAGGRINAPLTPRAADPPRTLPADDPVPTSPAARQVGPVARWVDVLLVVSVEFCFVIWAVSYLQDVVGLSGSAAPAAGALFGVGMATGRALASPVLRRIPNPDRVLACSAVLALGGFALYWCGGAAGGLRVIAALSGLLFAGLGVALLYPVSISQLVAAMPDRPAVATARASLASGLAVTFAPLLLAALSDSLGLRTAYLLVPALLLVVVLRAARRPAPRLVEGRQACTKRARRRWLGSPAT